MMSRLIRRWFRKASLFLLIPIIGVVALNPGTFGRQHRRWSKTSFITESIRIPTQTKHCWTAGVPWDGNTGLFMSRGRYSIVCPVIAQNQTLTANDTCSPNHTISLPHLTTRRHTLQGMAAILTAAYIIPPLPPARAGKPELDASTGQLFSPRPEMLSGGSTAARGIPVSSRERLQPGTSIQSIYETRFVTYLSRFLLNFDPAAQAWWLQQGLGNSWDQMIVASDGRPKIAEDVFAEFAQSVEVGLADYFSGPFGSYSSVSAAVAGLSSNVPAKSKKVTVSSGSSGVTTPTKNIVDRIFQKREPNATLFKSQEGMVGDAILQQAKQGVLNLYALLKARYTSIPAKRQLAILFSFISEPRLQPVSEIRSLLGEADNATISKIEVYRPDDSVAYFRESSRLGGGYSIREVPRVSIAASPPLGDRYRSARGRAIMRPTSRILRITVTDGGQGYTSAPTVTVAQQGYQRSCQASAILDREGRVTSIIVLDPGFGFGGQSGLDEPYVRIEPPSRRPRPTQAYADRPRIARAIAELEFEVAAVEVVDGGSGYVISEPPQVEISPPSMDPDWYISVQRDRKKNLYPEDGGFKLTAKVTEMRASGVAVVLDHVRVGSTPVDEALLDRLERDPVELLPSSTRPELRYNPGQGDFFYSIPTFNSNPQFVAVLPQRFRACDPIFGCVGQLPVTRGASSLTASEYIRLALSGAVCTVVVRTALNPLELIKTKQQLRNDDELFMFASEQKSKVKWHVNATSDFPQSTSVKIGVRGLLQSMVELRGWASLFQSADITFLASIIFGSFGFGATELFRRSFTDFFSSSGSNGDFGSEVVLLLAAALATVVTAAAAAPFELLRVRSMGMIESKQWIDVLRDFVNGNKESMNTDSNGNKLDILRLEPSNLLPLWAGFAPTVSRELPFAIAKFLTFDLLSRAILDIINSDAATPVQVGVGSIGLSISAFSGSIAGIAGAIISHPADLILTKTSARGSSADKADWRDVVKEIISQEGGVLNLFSGLGARCTFFFLVIGLQFFLYDYVKNLFQVGQDDLTLVLDVFYAVRAGLLGGEMQ